MQTLPVPDGGWPHPSRQVIAIVVFWAIAAFGFAALVLPTMDPQCYSDNGTHVCPLDPDPALTHLFDTRWPPVPVTWAALALFLSMMLGVGLAIFLDTSDPWSETGGAPAVVGSISVSCGIGLGLLVAGPGFVHPLVALGCTGLGALLIVLSLLGVRGFQRVLRRRYARHLRREHLREHGTRTVATVTELEWRRRYGGKEGEEPVFAVTARLTSEPNARTVTEELTVPRADSPVVRGTVIVVHDDQEGHETGIDVLLEPDPDGLRDRDALEKYPPAPAGSPS